MRARVFVVLAAVLVALALLPPAALGAEAWPAGSLVIDLDVTRLGGANRYETAVAIAQDGWPGWVGITHVVVASGEDRAFSDPLAAGSLCWAYDAPLLLVRTTGVPPATETALRRIVEANGPVKIVVVGGRAAVQDTVLSRLRAIVGTSGVERLIAGGDRYDLAAAIARRVSAVAAESSRTVPPAVMVANGTTEAGFVDALALSAISARTGVPVLLVKRESVPDATRIALAALRHDEVIVAGSTAVVSASTYSALRATARWAGPTRYETCVEVAKGARQRGWLDGTVVGIAAAVPDALTGSVYLGRFGGLLLHTSPAALSRPAAAYLGSLGAGIQRASVFGSTAVVSADLANSLAGAPAQPVIASPANAAYVAKKVRFRVTAGINTSELRLYKDGVLVTSVRPSAYQTVDFGEFTTPTGSVAYQVEARNPLGESASWKRSFKRLTYPTGSTSIVIDKSEYRLYFIKGDVLVKAYPIAVGRDSMETPARLWKILAKYYTDPGGVYGPRKMRLFKWTGTSWAYTAYGIHGTNEPWVIGTKASHGCIRLYNRDILELFPQVPLGTLVQTRE